MSDTSLSRSTAAMAAGTMLSRLTGFGRVFAIAYALGFARLGDAYNLANTTPNIIYDLVLGGILSASLVPVFVDELAQDDEDDAWRGISAVVTVVGAALIVLTALFALAAPLIIRVYLAATPHTHASAAQRAIATTLLRLFAPQVLLLGVITLTQAILNARHRFANPAFTPIANNLVAIGVILWFPHLVRSVDPTVVQHEHPALLWLGLGTTAGYVLQAGLQVPALRSAGARLRVVWQPAHAAVRSVLRLSGWLIGVVLANQVALVVVLVLANRRAGDFSAYNGAYQFFLLPHAIFAVSIGTALTPDLAAHWSAGLRERFGERMWLGVRSTLFALVPAAVGYAMLARPIIGVGLQHGHLTGGEAHRTAVALAAFAVGLPGFSLYLLLMRCYQAMKDTRAMFGLYLVENAINVVVAVAVYRRFAVVGLAASWSIAYTMTAALALGLLIRRVGAKEIDHTVRAVAKVVVAAAVMAAAVALVGATVGRGVVGLSVAVAAGATVYVGAARLLGVEELDLLMRSWRRRS